MTAPKKATPVKSKETTVKPEETPTPATEDTTVTPDDTTSADDTDNELPVLDDSRFENLERVLGAVVTDLAATKGLSPEAYVELLLPEEKEEE